MQTDASPKEEIVQIFSSGDRSHWYKLKTSHTDDFIPLANASKIKFIRKSNIFSIMLQKFSILFLFRFKTQSAIKVFDLKLEKWTYNYMCILINIFLFEGSPIRRWSAHGAGEWGKKPSSIKGIVMDSTGF